MWSVHVLLTKFFKGLPLTLQFVLELSSILLPLNGHFVPQGTKNGTFCFRILFFRNLGHLQFISEPR